MPSINETCELQTAQMALLGVMDTLTVLTGQPLAACLLWLILTAKRAHVDVLNFNLALFHNCQYGMSAAHLCIMLAWPQAQKSVLQFLLVYAQTGGPMSLCLVCVERYVAVVHPTSYCYLRRYRCRELSAATVWLISLPSAFFVAFARRSPNTFTAVVQKIFPFCLMLLLMVVVQRCSARITLTLQKAGPGKATLHPSKRRALATVRATSTVAALCYIPVSVLTHFNNHESLNTCLITTFSIGLLSLASIVHPALYLYTHLR